MPEPLPMETETWTIAFEGEDVNSIDIYLDPEWHNGIGPLCCTMRFVNSGQVVSYHELNPKSLKAALAKVVDYLDEMIAKRAEEQP